MDLRTAVTGYDLISYLIRNKMILLPIVMDPFGQLGPVIRRMLYKKHKQIPGYHNIETTNAVELQMQTAVRKHAPIGLLDRAQRVWQYTKK